MIDLMVVKDLVDKTVVKMKWVLTTRMLADETGQHSQSQAREEAPNEERRL